MFTRLLGLGWAHMFITYGLWTLMIYLTDVWKLTFTHAAAILNVYMAVIWIMPLSIQVVVDTCVANYWVLVMSSLAVCAGMGFFTLSTPPMLSKFTETCASYEPECVGDTQRILFYTALALTALGTAGHIVSLAGFMGEQVVNEIKKSTLRTIKVTTFVVNVVAVLGLPYIKPWSLHFGIPAILVLVATLVFFSGSKTYTYGRPEGSNLTMMARVFVASASKLFHPYPAHHTALHGFTNLTIPRTRGLRCLNRAAIVLPDQSVEEQQNNRWKLCTMEEIESTKLIISMIPMAMSFIFLGLLVSLGFTFFVEQAKNMNHKVERLTIPLPIFWWFFVQGKEYVPKLYFKLARSMCLRYPLSGPPLAGLHISLLLGLLCCVAASRVESHRLDVVKSHGLSDKPDETVPLSVFWLLPQFFLLGATDGMSEISTTSFNDNFFSPYLNKYYMRMLGYFRTGLGCLGSIFAVHMLGKISERGGKPSWFQDTINHSRLDNYYWFLSCLCAINFVMYIVMRCIYFLRLNFDDGQSSFQQPDCCCCFC